MNFSTFIKYWKNAFNRMNMAGTATSVAFITEEYIVAIKSLHMSQQEAYDDIKLISSYCIFGTAFIEPVAEILIDNVKALSNQKAKTIAVAWRILLDTAYTDCICLYFFGSVNQKTGDSYWYAVALPSFLIAIIANKGFRKAVGLLPSAPDNRLYKTLTMALDVSCEAIKGFVLGYDVLLEIGAEIPALDSVWLSGGCGLIYALFHGAVYCLKLIQADNTDVADKLDAILQTIFDLLATTFFTLYIKETVADTNPHQIIQLVGYGIILAYIFGRPCITSPAEPLIDNVDDAPSPTDEHKKPLLHSPFWSRENFASVTSVTGNAIIAASNNGRASPVPKPAG